MDNITTWKCFKCKNTYSVKNETANNVHCSNCGYVMQDVSRKNTDNHTDSWRWWKCSDCKINNSIYNIECSRCGKKREGEIEQSTEGPKETLSKPDYSVLPWEAIQEIVPVFEYGAKKYHKPFTYRKGVKYSKLFAAIIRHTLSWWFGNDIDKESGCKHLAHIAANCLMLLSIQHLKQFDDRITLPDGQEQIGFMKGD